MPAARSPRQLVPVPAVPSRPVDGRAATATDTHPARNAARTVDCHPARARLPAARESRPGWQPAVGGDPGAIASRCVSARRCCREWPSTAYAAIRLSGAPRFFESRRYTVLRGRGREFRSLPLRAMSTVCLGGRCPGAVLRRATVSGRCPAVLRVHLPSMRSSPPGGGWRRSAGLVRY